MKEGTRAIILAAEEGIGLFADDMTGEILYQMPIHGEPMYLFALDHVWEDQVTTNMTAGTRYDPKQVAEAFEITAAKIPPVGDDGRLGFWVRQEQVLVAQ